MVEVADGAGATIGSAEGQVGGLSDEIGPLQFFFLRWEGLRPEHTLVDVGCGGLLGGVHFVRSAPRPG